MKYFRIFLLVVAAPALAALVAEWLKAAPWARPAGPLLDFLTGAVPVPRVAVIVLIGGVVCVALVEVLAPLLDRDDPVPRPRADPPRRDPRDARRDYLRRGPATLFGSGPERVPLSRAEELVMIALARADPQPIPTAALGERIGGEPALALEHAVDLLIARQMAAHETAGSDRVLQLTPRGRALAVHRAYDEAKTAGMATQPTAGQA